MLATKHIKHLFASVIVQALTYAIDSRQSLSASKLFAQIDSCYVDAILSGEAAGHVKQPDQSIASGLDGLVSVYRYNYVIEHLNHNIYEISSLRTKMFLNGPAVVNCPYTFMSIIDMLGVSIASVQSANASTLAGL